MKVGVNLHELRSDDGAWVQRSSCGETPPEMRPEELRRSGGAHTPRNEVLILSGAIAPRTSVKRSQSCDGTLFLRRTAASHVDEVWSGGREGGAGGRSQRRPRRKTSSTWLARGTPPVFRDGVKVRHLRSESLRPFQGQWDASEKEPGNSWDVLLRNRGILVTSARPLTGKLWSTRRPRKGGRRVVHMRPVSRPGGLTKITRPYVGTRN